MNTESATKNLIKRNKFPRFLRISAIVFVAIFTFAMYSLRADSATAPSTISYQGKLLISGYSASTTQQMYFILYDSLSGGSILYTASGTIGTPNYVNVTPILGLFTVDLGDTGTNALDPDIFKDNSNIYLEVRIGAETLTPRKKITATPYSFNSRYLDGVAPSTNTNTTYIPISDSSGNFNFNNVTSTGAHVSGLLNVIGNSYFGTIASGTWQGQAISTGFGGTGQNSAGWTGFIKVTAGVWSTSTLDISSSVSGTLAIAYGGTGTSTAPIFGQLLMGNASGGYDLVATSSLGIVGIDTTTTPAGATGQIQYNNAGFFDATSTFVWDDANGWLGIGTTTPDRALTVNGNGVIEDLSINQLFFDVTPAATSFQPGKMFYDTTHKTVSVELGTDTTLQLGQEEWVLAFNDTGSTLANGSVVYITGSSSTLGLPTIAAAKATSYEGAFTVGVVTEGAGIANGTSGFVTVRGIVHDVNTNSWEVGDNLYLSDTTSGTFSNTIPAEGNYKVRVGRVLVKDASVGSIYIRQLPESRVQDLSDVLASSPSANQCLVFNGLSWTNGSCTSISAGQSVNFYLNDVVSTVSSTMMTLERTPVTTAEIAEVVSVPAGTTTTIDSYLSTSTLGGTIIDSGVWVFSTYASSSGGNGIQKIIIDVYAYDASGATTQLFSVQTGDIINTVPTLIDIETVQPAFSIASTTRLMAVYRASNSGNNARTIGYTENGTDRHTYFRTPITTRHNNLANLDYASAGHTGFAGLTVENIFTATNTFQGLSVLRNTRPETSLSYSLGTSAYRWSEIWAATMNYGTSTTWSITASTTNGRLGIFDQASGGGVERFSLLTSGNVGIGTTTPVYKLTVAGDLSVTGTLRVGNSADAGTAGYLLMSNGASAAPAWISTSTLGLTASDIGGFTAGSVIFASSTGALTQDNPNFFWDDANNRLGIGTTSPLAKFHIDGGGLLITGATGATPVSGAGSRLMWVPAKSAFRAGAIMDLSGYGLPGNTDQWDEIYVGLGSFAAGVNNQATGAGDTAFGMSTIASSTAAAFASGWGTRSTGWASTALGYFTTSSNTGSLSSGRYTIAYGISSAAFGNYSSSSGQASIAMGDSSGAHGSNSFAGGSNSITYGNSALAFGSNAQALAINSVAIGANVKTTLISEGYNFALGYDVEAGGKYHYLLGKNIISAATSLGNPAFAIGQNIRVEQTAHNSMIFNVGDDVVSSTQPDTLALMGGNVGINTTTPTFKLTIAGDMSVTGTLRVGDSADPGTLGYILMSNGASIAPTWVTTSSLGFTGSSIGGFTAGSVIFASSSGALTQDNSNFFWDDTNNYLGIGTTTPTAILSLPAGTTATSGINFGGDMTLYRTTANRLKTDNYFSAAMYYISGAPVISNDFTFQGANGTAANPTYKFQYDTNTGVYNFATDTIGWSTSGTAKMVLNASGNLGINTTTPSYKLTVVGDISTTGTYRINDLDYGQYFIDGAGSLGQLWSSDGSGRGTWVNASTGSGTVGTSTVDFFALYNSATSVTGTPILRASSSAYLMVNTTTVYVTGSVYADVTVEGALYAESIYTSGNSFYMNGSKVISSNSNDLNFYADTSQNIKVQAYNGTVQLFSTGGGNTQLWTSGAGSVQLNTTGGGNIDLNSNNNLTATATGTLTIQTKGANHNVSLLTNADNSDITLNASASNSSIFLSAFDSIRLTGNTNIIGNLSVTGTFKVGNSADPGTLGYVLMSNGASLAPTWVNTSSLGIAVSSLPYTGVTGLTAGSVVFASSSGALTQDNSNLFWDDTNNYLGIGTSTPSYPLHLHVNSPSPNQTLFRISLDTSASVFRIDEDGDTIMTGSVTATNGITTNYDNRLGNDTTDETEVNGFLMVNTSTPNAALTVLGISGNNAIVNFASSTKNSVFFIDANGNVGIGTTTPTYKLTVAGDMSVTGTLRVGNGADPGTLGYVLMSNGASLAPTWVNTSTLGITVTETDPIFDALPAAKGDIFTATANDTPSILSVGANGKVLVASSSATNGIDWMTTSSIIGTLGTMAYQNADAVAITGGTLAGMGTVTIDQGHLNVYDNLYITDGDSDMTSGIYLDATEVGQYFITSAGTIGQLWQSDGDGRGVWVNTSSLGIAVSSLAYTGVTGLTAGSVIFASSTGALTQDNSNFFWDDANNRLGVGTTTPNQKLTVYGNLSVATGTTPALFVDTATGRVGVGTSSPSSIFAINNVASFSESGTSFHSGGIDLKAGECYSVDGVCLESATTTNSLLVYTGIEDGYNISVVASERIYAFPTSTYEYDPNNWRTATSTITVPAGKGGTYIVGLQLANTAGTAIGAIIMGVKVNGTSYYLANDDSTGTSESVSGSIILNLQGGDVLQFIIKSSGTYSDDVDTARFWIMSTKVSTVAVEGDSLDFSHLVDAMSLDANTSINLSGKSLSFAGSAISSYFNSAGYLGIGTTTPTYKLTVAGDMSVTGTLRVGNGADPGTLGYVLMSNGASLAPTWVNTSTLGITVTETDPIFDALPAAKGDIFTATANDTPSILSVGANGKVLVASSSATNGIDWMTTSSIIGTLGTMAYQNADAVAITGGTLAGMGTVTIDQGHLNVYDNLYITDGDSDMTSGIYLDATEVGQYFITSAGTIGQLWQSDGDGRGVWVNTSSLGIAVSSLAYTGVTGLTAGSVIFASSTGALTQDNSNFFWDDTNNHLGIGTTTPLDKLHIEGGGLLATGEIGATPVSGAGTRLMWVPALGAFRAGNVGGTQWDNANIGQYSVAMGGGAKASGYVAVALGLGVTASGGNASVAIGALNTASGDSAVALGRSMTVSGALSFGVNVSTTAATLSQANTIAFMGGNVGINTTTPSYRLTVAGDMSVTGTLRVGNSADAGTSGYILRSNGSSAAPSWVTTSSLVGTLGTMAYQNANAVAVTGGTLAGMGTVTIDQGHLNVYDNLYITDGDGDMVSGIYLDATEVGQYFITSAGTIGQLWQSDGDGRGAWVNTSTLGISASSISYSGVTGLTAGSVVFASSTGVLTQDNSNFFWDDTNNRLGIGVSSTLTGRLHIKSSAADFATLYVEALDGSQLAGLYEDATGTAYLMMNNADGANQILLSADGNSFFAGGSVGIGDVPHYLFDVAGASGFDGLMTMNGSAANIALGSNWLSGDGGDEGVFVSSTGIVGIGTANPTEKLTLYDGNILLTGTTNSDQRSIKSYYDAGSLLLQSGTTGNGVSSINLVSGNGVPYIQFNASSTEYMRITRDGNVGIGTTTPSTLLHLASAEAGRGIYLSGAGNIVTAKLTSEINATAEVKAGKLVLLDNSEIKVSIFAGSDSYLINNFGIGTTTPASKLNVLTSDDNDGIFLSNALYKVTAKLTHVMDGDGYQSGVFSLLQNSVEKVSIQAKGSSYFNGGNVGINTNTPASSLTVAGNIENNALAGIGNRAVYSTAAGVLTNDTSDIQLKKNIVAISDEINVLDALKSLRGVLFNWDTDVEAAKNLGAQRELGMIAQEVESVLPELVGANNNGYKSLNYAHLVGYLIEVAKAQQNIIEPLAAALNVVTSTKTLTIGSVSDPYAMNLTGDMNFISTSSSEQFGHKLSFSTTTIFESSVNNSLGNANAFIFNALNFNTSTQNNYILSLRSNNSPVFSVSSNGDVISTGNIYASSMVLGTSTNPGDLAERVDINPNETVEAGDVMMVDPNYPDQYQKTNMAYEPTVAGVISTNPTIIVGNGKTNQTAPLAMVGRVPVKITTINGLIKRGDLLVASNVPGTAMKYDPANDDSSKIVGIIGIALDNAGDSNTGKVMALIRTGWVYNKTEALVELQNQIGNMSDEGGELLIPEGGEDLTVTDNNGTISYDGTGHLNLSGNALINVSYIASPNNAWAINEYGLLIAKVTTSEGDKNIYGMGSEVAEITLSGTGTLQMGEVVITFATGTREIIDESAIMKVTVTPSENCNGVFVTDRSAAGFKVVEFNDGTSNAAFDWIVIAKRKMIGLDVETAPVDTTPTEPVPVETTPTEITPVETAPVETAPVETAPVETAPVETAPVETAPVETAPVETAPVETAPVETAPVETAPVETAPVETAPVETAPVETAPVDPS